MLIAALAFAPSDAVAQLLTLEYQQVVTRAMPGATAAFSLDPSLVGASAQNGNVTLIGRRPGSTNVIVVFGDRTESLQVLVGDPPVIVFPGMLNARANGGASGHYEIRYGSDAGILQGNLRFARSEGDRFTELAFGAAASRSDIGASPFSIPLATYTIRTPRRELTLMDRVITNSPLTVAGSNVRGAYVREGPWRMHAGYSFFGNFEHLLLPTDKESVAGVSYRYDLNPRSSLTPNIYYFDLPPESRRSGPLGTLLYEAQPAPDVKFIAELGAGRAIGGAVELEVDRPDRRAWAKWRHAPSALPSLSTDQQSGRHIEGGYMTHGDALSVNANVSSRTYTQGESAQTSRVGTLDLQRRLSQRWALHGGSGYSIFDDGRYSESKVQSITLPVGTSFSHRNVGLGLDYQFSRETTRDLAGHLVRASLSGAGRGFRLAAHGERQTHAPTARYIFTEVPWLQPMLDRLGLAADTPQQLANLMRTNVELAAFGYANNVTIDVTPVRTRAEASGGWSGSGALMPQFFASTLFNRDERIGGIALSAVHSLSYSQKIGTATELFFSWSALCNGRYVSSSCHPVMFTSLRRTLNSVPGILTRRVGDIQGNVFRDDQGRGVYSPDLPAMAGVEIVLDGVRFTRTDASGRFRFEGVPYGRHLVEARFTSDQPTFFTTPSPAEVDAGASVDFGIGRSLSSVRGILRTDAGLGVPGVVVHVTSSDRQITARTGDDGTFVADGVAAGIYDVTIEAGSVPAGYPVSTLETLRVEAKENAPGRVTFVLQPYRSVSGRARVFNRQSGQYVALPGATLELRPLGRKLVTDANGLYAFRDLPPGEYTVVASHGKEEHIVAVTVPAGPAFLKEIDLAVVARGDLVAESPAQRDRSARARAIPSASRNEPPLSAEPRDSKPAIPIAAAFTIQVATSANLRHARAMVSELKDGGHAAYLVEASGTDTRHQVRIGHYPTLAEADRAASTLERALGWRLRVMTEPPSHSSTSLVVQGTAASSVR